MGSHLQTMLAPPAAYHSLLFIKFDLLYLSGVSLHTQAKVNGQIVKSKLKWRHQLLRIPWHLVTTSRAVLSARTALWLLPHWWV